MAYVFSGLLGQLPLLAVLIAGFVLVSNGRARIGARSATLALAGLGLLTVDLVLQSIWNILFPRVVASLDLQAASFGLASFSVGLILALLTAIGIGLLIAALVSRSAPGRDSLQ
jgi:hypothetical protein